MKISRKGMKYCSGVADWLASETKYLAPIVAADSRRPAGSTLPRLLVMATRQDKTVEHVSDCLFHDIEQSRVPLKFLANLFGAGHEAKVLYALKKQKAVRWYRRALTVGDVTMETAERMLRAADCTIEQAEAIYQLTSLCTFEDRFVIPPAQREEAIQMMEDPHEHRKGAGFGFLAAPRRGL
jgi:nitrate reductase beta subunit